MIDVPYLVDSMRFPRSHERKRKEERGGVELAREAESRPNRHFRVAYLPIPRQVLPRKKEKKETQPRMDSHYLSPSLA